MHHHRTGQDQAATGRTRRSYDRSEGCCDAAGRRPLAATGRAASRVMQVAGSQLTPAVASGCCSSDPSRFAPWPVSRRSAPVAPPGPSTAGSWAPLTLERPSKTKVGTGVDAQPRGLALLGAHVGRERVAGEHFDGDARRSCRRPCGGREDTAVAECPRCGPIGREERIAECLLHAHAGAQGRPSSAGAQRGVGADHQRRRVRHLQTLPAGDLRQPLLHRLHRGRVIPASM